MATSKSTDGPLKVGLTGGIATGKSTVADLFKKRGWVVIDADDISRRLVAPGGIAHEQWKKWFGDADRSTIRERLFNDPKLKAKVEKYLHPLIARASNAVIEDALEQGENVIYEASLLIEAGRAKDFHAVLAVRASMPKRLERLKERGISKAQAMSIIKSQWPDEKKDKQVTLWITNDSTLEDLERRFQQMFEFGFQ